MSNFPNDFDDDTTLPFVNDNITEIGGEAINALRDVVFSIEQNIGLGAAGTTSSIANRFDVSFFPDGNLKPSVIAGLGLVTLPITQDQIAPWAAIPESKLKLDHRTQDLFNYIRDLSGDVNLAIGWISTTGVKLEPHLLGALYRHSLNQIDVSASISDFLFNKFRTFRDNTQAYNLIDDMNDELLAHQWADGSPFGNILNVTTNNGSVYPSNYAHTASGIFLNTTRFTVVPETAKDLQLFAEFVDSSSIFLLGTRIQNLYSNGITRASRSSTLDLDGYGQHLVPITPVIAYLKNIGNNSGPFDDINTGDDIIEFKPDSADSDNNSFDAKFALVKIGDVIRVNYGSVEVPFIIKEKKYIQNLGDKKYIVRIAGKNLAYAPNATARIDRPLFYNNKYGVLSISAVNNNFSEIPSLIVSSPKGGEALGVGFDPNQFDESHYLLYLALFPTGFPEDGYTILPPIDVTGNLGMTPGLYTLDSIVEATNNAFRGAGYNYRFVAFSYQGEFGIMLADPYGNAAFSILNGVVDDNGFFDQTATELSFTNNVIDLFPDTGNVGLDPLGFGPFGANVASPPYQTSYGSAESSQNPTKLFVPLNRNNFYINGIERDRLTLEVGQALDIYGDGYWVGTIVDKQIFPGPVPAGRVQVTYRIPLDLSTSGLKAGKTVVIQSLGPGSLVDFGRYIIQSVNFGCDPVNYTDITVYDAVHAKGFSPTTTLAVDGYVGVYFNSSSVSFNEETATDFVNVTPFKRHFEVYIDQNGATFTHERGRVLVSGTSILVNGTTNLYSSTELAKLDIVKISPKLRGYQFGSVTKITLQINNFNSATGIFDGYLASYDGVNLTRIGPTIFGKKGEVVRFYDETHIDYIDIIFDVNTSISTISNEKVDFQLFPTLSLDDEIMMIGTCQLNDTTYKVTRIRDERQFGNIGEKEFTTSALNFLSLPERLLHINGVVRGFDITNISAEKISLRGGVALVNGKFQSINDETFSIPKLRESYNFSEYPINWFLCVNSIGELAIIPMADYDSVLGTPNAPTRIFNVINVASSNTYNIDSTIFSNLINSFKDYTVLYIVSSTVTGSGTGATVSLTSRDVRRFINDQDSNIAAIVTKGNSQGNFKTVNSAVEWLRYNYDYQDTLSIKGAYTFTGAFNFLTKLHIIAGANNSNLLFNNSFTVTDFRSTDVPITITGTANLSNSIIDNGSFSVTGSTILNSVEFRKSGSMTFGGGLLATSVNFGNGPMSVTGAADLTNSFFNGTTFSSTGTATLIGTDFNGTSLTVGGDLICTDALLSNFSTNITGALTATTTTIDNWVGTVGGALTFTNVSVRGRYNTGITAGSISITGGATKELVVVSTGTITTASGGSDAYFENCFLTGTDANLSQSKFVNCNIVIGGDANITFCEFINCQITVTGTVTASFSLFEKCSLIDLNGSSSNSFNDIFINECQQFYFDAYIDVTNTTISNSYITANTVRGFLLNDNTLAGGPSTRSRNNFRFEHNYVIWNGNPSTGYSGTDLVNSGNGFFYKNVGSENFGDVVIDNNRFTYAMQDHFPIFSIQVTSYISVVRNVSFSNNIITSTAGVDDVRAVAAIISTLLTRASVGVFPQFPILTNVHLDDNTCNYNQMLIISGPKDTAIGSINGANPLAFDTTISGNVCGTIGYFIGSSGPYDGNNVGTPNQGVTRDKANKLFISRNNCKLITNLDWLGDYVCFRATSFAPGGTNLYEEVGSTIGEVTINNNTCNWIQVGAGGYTVAQSGANIINNTVYPSNPSFLTNFTSSGFQSVTPGNVGILLRREHNAIGQSSSNIEGNQIVQKYTTSASTGIAISTATNASPIVVTTSTPHGFLTGQQVNISGVLGNSAANGTWIITVTGASTFSLNGSTGNGSYTGGGVVVATNIWYYDAGIVCFNHAKIANNTISGVVNSTTSPMIYFWDINSQVVTGNVLERRGLSINAYFYMDGLSAAGTAVQRLLITSNILDAVDSGAGVTNRVYIRYGVGTTTPSSYQPGWRMQYNIAGSGPGTQFL